MTTTTVNGSDGTMDLGTLKLELASGAHLIKAAKKFLKRDMSKEGKRTIAAALTAYFVGLGDEVETLECGDCGGTQDASLPACPYCGATDDDDVPSAPPPPKNGAAAPIVLAGGAPLAKVTGSRDPVVVGTVKDLDVAVEKLRQLKGEGAIWAWRMGKHVYEAIYAPNLWTQRKGDDGKPLYKGFNQFCEAECGLTAKSVYAYMEMSQKFSEDDARKLGVTHLRLLMQAPPSAEAELKAMIAGGASKRELETKIRDAKSNGAAEPRVGIGKESARTAAATAAATNESRNKRKGMTCIIPEGKHQVKLWAKPASKKDDPKPAKKLGDKPYGRIECSNGVVVYVAVLENAAGQLVLSVEPRREEE